VAIVRKQLNIQKSLYEILQIVSVNVFEQIPLAVLLATQPTPLDQEFGDEHSQKLFWLSDK